MILSIKVECERTWSKPLATPLYTQGHRGSHRIHDKRFHTQDHQRTSLKYVDNQDNSDMNLRESSLSRGSYHA